MEFVGINNTYAESGSPEALLEKYGLTAAKVTDAVRRVISRKR
jgi:transketolase